MRFLTYFLASFVGTLCLILAIGNIIMEKRTHPDWYGTYYSYQDAMEDGWYEKN